MDLRQLEAVVAVADAGTFTAAAQRLHVSQPALSQTVKALEAELGVPLFDRLPRHARPTSAGLALLDRARLVLRGVQTARAAVEEVHGVRSGRLDLVALPTLAVDPVARLIGAFRRSHPGVTVGLAEPTGTEALLDMVRDGRAEIGVTDDEGVPAELEVLPLFEQTFRLVCPPGTPRGRRRRLRADEAAGRPFVVATAGTSSRRAFDRVFATVRDRPDIAVETAQREALLPLVLAGAGAALLPAAMAADAEALGAVVFDLDPPETRSIALVRRRHPPSPAAKAFVNGLVTSPQPPSSSASSASRPPATARAVAMVTERSSTAPR